MLWKAFFSMSGSAEPTYVSLVREIGLAIEEKGFQILNRHVLDSDDPGKMIDEFCRNSGVDRKDVMLKVFEVDSRWVNECEIFFADVTYPSTGSGIEIEIARNSGKKVVALCWSGAATVKKSGVVPSPFTSAYMKDNCIPVIFYSTAEEALQQLVEHLTAGDIW